jgi:hypothetical protein
MRESPNFTSECGCSRVAGRSTTLLYAQCEEDGLLPLLCLESACLHLAASCTACIRRRAAGKDGGCIAARRAAGAASNLPFLQAMSRLRSATAVDDSRVILGRAHTRLIRCF